MAKFLIRVLTLVVSFLAFLLIVLLFHNILGDVVFVFSVLGAVTGGLVFGPVGGFLSGLFAFPCVLAIRYFFLHQEWVSQIPSSAVAASVFSLFGLLIGFLVQTLNKLKQQNLTEAKLHDTEKKFTTFMDNMPNPAWIKDISTWEHSFVNRAYEKMFNRTIEEMRGKTDFELYPKKVAEDLRRHDEEIIKTGEPHKIYESVPDKDNVIHEFLVYKFPLNLSGKKFIAGLATDITELKKVEDELVARTAELEKVNTLMIGRELKMAEMKKQLEDLTDK